MDRCGGQEPRRKREQDSMWLALIQSIPFKAFSAAARIASRRGNFSQDCGRTVNAPRQLLDAEIRMAASVVPGPASYKAAN